MPGSSPFTPPSKRLDYSPCLSVWTQYQSPSLHNVTYLSLDPGKQAQGQFKDITIDQVRESIGDLSSLLAEMSSMRRASAGAHSRSLRSDSSSGLQSELSTPRPGELPTPTAAGGSGRDSRDGLDGRDGRELASQGTSPSLLSGTPAPSLFGRSGRPSPIEEMGGLLVKFPANTTQLESSSVTPASGSDTNSGPPERRQLKTKLPALLQSLRGRKASKSESANVDSQILEPPRFPQVHMQENTSRSRTRNNEEVYTTATEDASVTSEAVDSLHSLGHRRLESSGSENVDNVFGPHRRVLPIRDTGERQSYKASIVGSSCTDDSFVNNDEELFLPDENEIMVMARRDSLSRLPRETDTTTEYSDISTQRGTPIPPQTSSLGAKRPHSGPNTLPPGAQRQSGPSGTNTPVGPRVGHSRRASSSEVPLSSAINRGPSKSHPAPSQTPSDLASPSSPGTGPSTERKSMLFQSSPIMPTAATAPSSSQLPPSGSQLRPRSADLSRSFGQQETQCELRPQVRTQAAQAFNESAAQKPQSSAYTSVLGPQVPDFESTTPLKFKSSKDAAQPTRSKSVRPHSEDRLRRKSSGRKNRDPTRSGVHARSRSQPQSGSEARVNFTRKSIESLLNKTEECGYDISQLNLPEPDLVLLEKFVDALSKLSVEVELDEGKRAEGRRRMKNALMALEGWI